MPFASQFIMVLACYLMSHCVSWAIGIHTYMCIFFYFFLIFLYHICTYTLHPVQSETSCMHMQVPHVLGKQFADRHGLTPLGASACLSSGATPLTRQALAVHMGG